MDLEPEKKASMGVWIKMILKILAGIIIFFYVIVENVNKIGKLKSESLNLVKKTEISYDMTNDLLPMHYFSEFSKDQITDRMECLINRNP